ncbi:MAG: SMP-30/gluconolactonase/LRE family protein [Gemmatimonadetes bacterium]|nr:SMP-30/gluconolactonase/LRE family protein [Gemmatimonadota bacterium]
MTKLRKGVIVSAAVFLGCAGERRAAPPPGQQVTIREVGFQTPESVLYDEVGDVYVVSNINGSPLEKDDNGFLSRVSPDGAVLALKWIDGATADVTLHAPKGLGIKGDTLFVADIDAVRLFHRTTGAPLGAREIAGARFLNDIAVGPDGSVYLTDSGLQAGPQGFAPSGTDALYRFDASGRAVAVARDTSLGRPNGVYADSTGVVVVSIGSGEVYQLDPASGARTALPKPPAGSLDGVVRLADGSLLVSSWDARAVYRRAPGGTWTVAVDSVEAPADIGYDSKRDRVLIPLFTANEVRIAVVR